MWAIGYNILNDWMEKIPEQSLLQIECSAVKLIIDHKLNRFNQWSNVLNYLIRYFIVRNLGIINQETHLIKHFEVLR